MTTQHENIVDPYIHEVKGAAAASADQILVANGAGSASFTAPAVVAAILGPLVDITGQFPYGGLYFTTPSVTTISASGTYYKAAGATTVTNARQFDMPANNRLRYLGTTARHFHIVLQCSITFDAGANQIAGIQLWKYDDSAGSGSLVAHSEAKSIVASTDIAQITSHADAMLDENDYIEIHVANHDNTNDIQVDLGYMFLVGMPT